MNSDNRMIMKKIILPIVSLFVFQCMFSQQIDQSVKTMIESASTMIKSDPNGATLAFNQLLKGKNKKNTAILVEIGRAYLNADDLTNAELYVKKAKGVDNKKASVYLLSGDIYLKKADASNASSEYSQAIYFDENCTEAYLKYAEVYKGVNPQLSIDMLEKLKVKTPEDTRVDKLMGDIYYSMGKYRQAIDRYNVYMQNADAAEADYAKYATLLYLDKDYTKSQEVVQKGLASFPKNHVLNRLSMYNFDEMKKYDEGIEAAKKFFSNSVDNDYVYLDYVYYGRLLASVKKYDEAIAEFDKAIKLEETPAEILKEISDAYEKKHDYDNAISYYEKYLDKASKKDDATELFLFGRLNYYAVSDSAYQAKQSVYLDNADKTFAKVAETAPDSYLGNFWRARTNSLKDPETTSGLAKPYYEAALNILLNSSSTAKSQIIECESYLGYYYFVKGDNEQSKKYWNKILEIDPQNGTALKALKGIK